MDFFVGENHEPFASAARRTGKCRVYEAIEASEFCVAFIIERSSNLKKSAVN